MERTLYASIRKTICISLTIVILLASAIALAGTAGASAGGFSVSPVMPDNQNPESRGYFDLRVSPGQKQELTVTISNSGSEEIGVSLNLLTVSTNINGIVDYTSSGKTDETMINVHMMTL